MPDHEARAVLLEVVAQHEHERARRARDDAVEEDRAKRLDDLEPRRLDLADVLRLRGWREGEGVRTQRSASDYDAVRDEVPEGRVEGALGRVCARWP